MKYQLLLKDFVKYTAKAGLDTTELKVGESGMSVVQENYFEMLVTNGSSSFYDRNF